jgi:hypothetical protein
MFGQPANNNSPFGSGGFGQTNSAPFGQTNQQPSAFGGGGGGGFGSTASPFGAPSPAPSTAQTTFGGGGFGSTNNTGSAFGQAPANSGNLFGAPSPAPSSFAPSFGSGGGGFGSNTGNSAFGSSNNATPGFASPSTFGNNTGGFGQAAAPSTGGLFGAPAPSTGATFGGEFIVIVGLKMIHVVCFSVISFYSSFYPQWHFDHMLFLLQLQALPPLAGLAVLLPQRQALVCSVPVPLQVVACLALQLREQPLVVSD